MRLTGPTRISPFHRLNGGAIAVLASEQLGGAVYVGVIYHVGPGGLKDAAMYGRTLAIWIAIGIGVGAALGAALDNMGLWVALGVAGGAAAGAALSRKKRS